MRFYQPLLAAAAVFIGLLCSSDTNTAFAADVPAESSDKSSRGVSIDHVTTRHIPAGLFKRISEYFTGVENKGGKIIERSQPDDRGGYYLIVTLDLFSAPIPNNSVFVVEYIHSDDRRPQIRMFPMFDDCSSACEAFLGLTGEDWPSPERSMVAWKITLLGSDGKTVLATQSYLWDIPEENSTTPASTEG